MAMKQIQKDELYAHLSDFLRDKGIELKEGSYSKGIHAGCSLLADAINLSQTGIERAKTELDKQLQQVRQVIHEKTAPKGRTSSAGPSSQAGAASKTAAGSNGRAAPRKKARKPASNKGGAKKK
jgi:hypothetical protein